MGFRDEELVLGSVYGPGDDRLHNFFVPVLQRSVRYDRTSGYFTSSALVSVARGLVGFLHNGGRMRLLMGVQLSEADVTAIESGPALEAALVRQLLQDPIEGAALVQQRRFEVLAWMVREERLEVRIAVPLGSDGRPVVGGVAAPYYHKKSAVFCDEAGSSIAIVGSNNESAMGWEEHGNAEEFHVFKSWRVEAWQDHGRPIRESFEREWCGDLACWRVMPLPDAVREHLIKRVPYGEFPYETEADLEREPKREAVNLLIPTASGKVPVEEAVERLERLRDAPCVGGGTGVGIVTAPVEPWPHQRRIAYQVTSTFPRSYLLADEVGMGKTIEAGLVFRELLLSGKASRILILVPASVIKQWQEELWEKTLLRVPRLDGNAYFYRAGGEDEPAIPATSGNPWGAFPVLLASSHLARMRKRRPQVLAAGPWDVVFVDEAHHARRKGSKPDASPNELLALLQAMKAAGSWRALYLASATPMQMHAHEAWDLLELLGLTERWGRSAEAFTTYYAQLREAYASRDWAFLAGMLQDHLSDAANAAPAAASQRVRALVPSTLRAKRILEFQDGRLSRVARTQLGEGEREALDLWLRENTPMRRRVFRTTRSTLHEYKELGLLAPETVIPERHVTDRFIDMKAREAGLYARIEEYIGRYYNRYKNGPAAQRALGFIMTIYRRRLTSSFQAITRSLQKRRNVLRSDNATLNQLLDEDDVATIDSGSMFELEELEDSKTQLDRELTQLDEFLSELEGLPPDESKMDTLLDDLHQAFYSGHRTAIVFTQYTDTLDYVAEKLTGTYGSAVATWSGAGGRRWNPTRKAWDTLPKSELKDLFRAGEEVRILVGTDSMSEGLNLQTCALLVNYDMPWNFMRVEQRIGRIDRIGGQPQLEIFNYFYKGTVEQRIYEGLEHDLDWFENVVGPAQPILGQIESIIGDAAMRPPDTSLDESVRDAIERVRADLAEAREQPVQLDEANSGAEDGEPEPVVTLEGLKDELLTNPLTNSLLTPSHHHPGAYNLAVNGREGLVTFDRELADAGEADFLTFGASAFAELLQAALPRG